MRKVGEFHQKILNNKNQSTRTTELQKINLSALISAFPSSLDCKNYGVRGLLANALMSSFTVLLYFYDYGTLLKNYW